ncbi:hypothetical protein GCM10022223_32160 [Kineosporia mesophila]|uniref:DUF732 domain-containing protein n=1 Tax=Kineosporia mesophila TaxID=566012 RepID=A0ABP6ZLF3_9ACTN|nr:hypothetical protein [Kineosporia mesophila]MCD5354457.1 hypothetical protein [Kineosporia mesophila]
MKRLELGSRTPRALGICAVLAAVVVLSGCDDATDGIGYTSGLSGTETAGPGTAPDSTPGTRDAGDEAPVTSASFCAFLEDEATKVDGMSTVTVRRTLVDDISDLYASAGTAQVDESDRLEMDALAKSCPGDAAAVMLEARIISFAQL